MIQSIFVIWVPSGSGNKWDAELQNVRGWIFTRTIVLMLLAR
jgi:hypothetical protein